MKYYPDNTSSNFTVKMDPPLDLEGRYALGLFDIIYPRNWFNVTDTQYWLTVKKKKAHQTVTVPGGYYASMEEVVQEINDAIYMSFKPGAVAVGGNPPVSHYRQIFNYKRQSGKTIICLDEGVRLYMNDNLKDALGVKPSNLRGGVQYVSARAIDLDQGHTCLYVYLSVLEDRVVGDTRAPLLRMIPMRGKHNEVVFESFQNPHFVPLKLNSFDHITVHIRNGAGELIPFQPGEVILTVQLQRGSSF